MTTTRQWSIFFGYTAYSTVAVLMMVPLGVLLLLDARFPALMVVQPVATTMLLVQILVGGWSGWRIMRRWSRSPATAMHGRWDLPRLGILQQDPGLLLLAALSAVIAVATVPAGSDPRLLLASMALLLVVAGLCWPWWVGALAALALGLVGIALGAAAPPIAVGFALVLAGVTSTRATLWLAAVVRELEDAREAHSQLAVAEERLRFARDLHDVTGRDLSVIAVKTELVAQLAERGDPRAAEHGREAAQIARTSLAEIRSLVRGYREADLATELQGTASLLRSAHVEVTVHGAAEDVPAARAGTAAWVLREGGTNILRHADPSAVEITLRADGVTMVNDGAPEDAEIREGSGLAGMRERLDGEARLDVHREGGTFTLDVRFDPPGGPR